MTVIKTKIELNTLELKTLYKSVYTAKFLYYGFHSWKIAFDRNAGELLRKIEKQANQSYFEERNKQYETGNKLFIEKSIHFEQIMEVAKKHLSEFDEWIEYTDEEKKQLVENLLYPLHYQDETFEELMEFRK